MSESLKEDERKAWACMLYTKLDYSVHDTAVTVNADETMVEQWIEEDAWNGQKLSLLLSRNKQLKLMYALVDSMNEKISTNLNAIDPKDVEIIVKYTRAIKNLENKVTVTQMMEVFELFLLWLKKKDIVLTKMISLRCDAFIKLHMR
jgi:hypothetical protein